MKHISIYLDEALREFFEERAGILEHDAGLPKEKAEAIAKAETDSWSAHREQVAAKAGGGVKMK